MTRKIDTTFLCACNQRVRRIGEFFKNKKDNRLNINRLSFVTWFKMEFLLPFTCCRKVLRKMPGEGWQKGRRVKKEDCLTFLNILSTKKTCSHQVGLWKLSITEKRRNMTKYLTWNSIRLKFLKKTCVKKLGYIKFHSSYSPWLVNSPS